MPLDQLAPHRGENLAEVLSGKCSRQLGDRDAGAMRRGDGRSLALRINGDMANNWRMIQRRRLALQIALILTTARWRDFSRSWGLRWG